jgi:hypothetical protein
LITIIPQDAFGVAGAAAVRRLGPWDLWIALALRRFRLKPLNAISRVPVCRSLPKQFAEFRRTRPLARLFRPRADSDCEGRMSGTSHSAMRHKRGQVTRSPDVQCAPLSKSQRSGLSFEPAWQTQPRAGRCCHESPWGLSFWLEEFEAGTAGIPEAQTTLQSNGGRHAGYDLGDGKERRCGPAAVSHKAKCCTHAGGLGHELGRSRT